MDLLATVRKEGSRGGRTDFKWSDVQNSTRREHYLGHSLMAPVGRWAKGRDLNWYAKGDEKEEGAEDPAEKAARERREEIKRVKEAEEDALARALGLPVPERNNANLEPVSDKRHADKLTTDPSIIDDNGAKGLGYGKKPSSAQDLLGERIQGNAEEQDKQLQYALREHRRRHQDHDRDNHKHDRERHRRPSSRDRDSSRRRRHDRSRERHRARRSRSRSPPRRHESNREREHGRERDRSRSPHRSRKSNPRRH